MRNALLLCMVFAAGCSGEMPGDQSSEPSTEAGERSERALESNRLEDDRVRIRIEGEGNVTIETPDPGTVVTSNPIEVSGTARTFENNVVLQLLDSEGSQIVETSTTAHGELGEFNPWSARLWITRWPGSEVTLRALEHSAKDGSIRSLASLTLDNNAKRREVTLHFPNAQRSSDDCSAVFPVTRVVPESESIARLLVEALIAGPTETETIDGFSSEFPRGTRVESVQMADGVVTVDLSPEARNVGGSCRVAAIRSSIETTLGPLPGVDHVRITAGGSEALALQP